MTTVHSLTSEEQGALVDALGPTTVVERATRFISDGARPTFSTVLLSGAACREKDLGCGLRQILALHYAGDMVDICGFHLGEISYSVNALSRCEIAQLEHASLISLAERYPRIGSALGREMALDSAIVSAWLANVGQRPALERLANFFCEQYMRMNSVGLIHAGGAVDFPLTQTDVADATGMSLVHVNKRLQHLRDLGMIGRALNRLEVLNWEELRALAGFQPQYLQLREAHRELDPA